MIQVKGNQFYEISTDIVTGPNDEQKNIYKKIIYNAGSILNTASNCYSNNLKKLIDKNKISISQIDEAVLRILELKNELGLFETPYGYSNKKIEKKYIYSTKNLEKANKLTEETFVLLKNKNNILPINKNKKIALIGPYIDNKKISSSWSIFVEEENTQTIKEIFEEKIGREDFIYSKGCEVLEKQEMEDLLKIQTKKIRDKNSNIYQEKEILFEINEEMLKFWNEKLEYISEKGKFKVFVGTNSQDTLEDTFEYE